MKKVILFFLLATFLIGCGKSKVEYRKELISASDSIYEMAVLSSALSDNYIEVWRTAIYDKTYGGRYVSDFNEALTEHKAFTKSQPVFWEYCSKRERMDSVIRTLKDYPSSCKEEYDELISIYADVDEMCRNAIDPSGSLQSYSNSVRTNYDNVQKKLKEFKVKYGNDE